MKLKVFLCLLIVACNALGMEEKKLVYKPYRTTGNARKIKARDFDNKIGILKLKKIIKNEKPKASIVSRVKTRDKNCICGTTCYQSYICNNISSFKINDESWINNFSDNSSENSDYVAMQEKPELRSEQLIQIETKLTNLVSFPNVEDESEEISIVDEQENMLHKLRIHNLTAYHTLKKGKLVLQESFGTLEAK